MTHRIGIDLGGTKIEGALLDPEGRMLSRRRVATPREDYDGTLEAVIALVRRLEADLDGATAAPSVGIGMPGALSRATGLVKNANSTWLIGRPIDRDLAQRLGRPVRVANDADCFALSEAVDGAATGASPVFGVILGTGVGGGIVVDGLPLAGANGIAGEWGHNPLPWAETGADPAMACYCGRHGCIETFLSGPGFVAHHRARTGEALTSPEIVERAMAGDPAAERSLALYVDRLARALAHVINIVDPEVIVLGGGMSRIARLYERVPALWGSHVFSDAVTTRLVPPIHGDSAGVRGAAWLWRDGEEVRRLVWDGRAGQATP